MENRWKDYSQAVSVDESLANLEYRDLEKPSDIFVYQNAVHAVDMNGNMREKGGSSVSPSS
ncbi:MAG TPA: hypothetical protein VLC79_00520 [Cellvibrio sp.]|nr:hypothetical protein [Cellvibrio sp.]